MTPLSCRCLCHAGYPVLAHGEPCCAAPTMPAATAPVEKPARS